MIPQCRLDRQFNKLKNEYEEAALSVLNSGVYIKGRNVSEFESEFASFIGTKNCIGVGNGTDALTIAIRALRIGEADEVILPANAFVASWIAVCSSGAKPVAVDTDEDFNINASLIEEKINKKTKLILVQHLYGKICKMDKITAIAKKYNIPVLEDCAQSVGAKFNGKNCGTFGNIACFSFYPTKNLGALGDGGAITTNDKNLIDKCRRLAAYGSDDSVTYTEIGRNSRLDELQAALLRVSLTHIEALVADRRKTAEAYLQGIQCKSLILPEMQNEFQHAFHQFVVRVKDRERFTEYLKSNGINTKIHYEKPVYLSPAYKFLKYTENDFPKNTELNSQILSLPFFFGITDEEIKHIIKVINSYE